MRVGLTTLRGGLVAALIAVALPAATLVAATTLVSPAAAQTASSIVVEGNRRVEADTIRTYFKPGPGGRLDSATINDALNAAGSSQLPLRSHHIPLTYPKIELFMFRQNQTGGCRFHG